MSKDNDKKRIEYREIDAPWEVTAERETDPVKWLRSFLAQLTTEEGEPLIDALRRMIAERPDNWISGHHFFFGMWVRNQMRMNGFGEKELGVPNLDDVYVSMIEQAVLGT